MVTDVERRDPFQALETSLGEGPARVMMELLPPVGWADVARQSDLVAIRGEMAQLGAELRGEIADLRTEVRTGMADLRVEIADLRAEVRAQLPRFVLANVPLMVALSGLVLAAVKLG